MPDAHRVAVAFSGGRDSTALLHAVAREALNTPGTQVLALHVHHGLSEHADQWLGHARALCENWRLSGLPVRLVWRRVQVRCLAGESLEAQARAARYQALQDMALDEGVDLVLLAHHRRDQAETFLLQALRGAGVAGLAAMPRERWRAGVRWVRPWLAQPREAIEAYIQLHALPFVEDDSNADLRFARNRLRLSVWPALEAAFPQAEAALAASAARVSDVLPPLAAWADAALPAITQAQGGREMLDVRRWSAMPAGEQREALRHWYRRQSGRAMPASALLRLASDLPGMLQGAGVAQWPDLGLRLYRGHLMWRGPPEGEVLAQAPAGETRLCVTAPGVWPVPAWGGGLQVADCVEGGVSPERLRELRVCARTGGEQFQLGAGRPARSLKKQFQAQGVPPWARQGPLFYTGSQLLLVPALGVDARCLAQPGEPQWTLAWVALANTPVLGGIPGQDGPQ